MMRQGAQALWSRGYAAEGCHGEDYCEERW